MTQGEKEQGRTLNPGFKNYEEPQAKQDQYDFNHEIKKMRENLKMGSKRPTKDSIIKRNNIDDE